MLDLNVQSTIEVHGTVIILGDLVLNHDSKLEFASKTNIEVGGCANFGGTLVISPGGAPKQQRIILILIHFYSLKHSGGDGLHVL